MSEKQPWQDFSLTTPATPAEQQDQREGPERRQGSNAYDGPERRHGDDRRGKTFGLKFTTGRRLSELEDWLDDHCAGYHIAIEGLSEDFGRKTVTITFSRDEDRTRFREHFGNSSH